MTDPKKKSPRGRKVGSKLPEGESVKRLLLTGESSLAHIPEVERGRAAVMIAQDLAGLIVDDDLGILDAAKALPISYYKLALLRESYREADSIINAAIHARSERRQSSAFNNAYALANRAASIANQLFGDSSTDAITKIEAATRVASTLSLVATRQANAVARNMNVQINNFNQTQINNTQNNVVQPLALDQNSAEALVARSLLQELDHD